jgi:hypothetical protein
MGRPRCLAITWGKTSTASFKLFTNNLTALRQKLEGLEERYVLGVIELPSPPKREKVLIAQDFKCSGELHVIEPIKGLRGGCRPNIELINADSTS